MARLDGISVHPDGTGFSKVFTYVWAWRENHMDPNCVEDAIGAEEGRPALHFMSTELIQGCHFCLQLEKGPGVGNVLKEFNVTWLSHLDEQILQLGVRSSYRTTVGEGRARYTTSLETSRGGVLFRGDTVTVVPEDHEYFLSLHVTPI